MQGQHRSEPDDRDHQLRRRRIVFERYDTSTSHLYVINADGTGVTKLSETARAEYAPNWGPSR